MVQKKLHSRSPGPFGPEKHDALLSIRRWPRRRCLRMARVRLDMANMLAARFVFSSFAQEGHAMGFYLLLDGSTASGFETFALIEHMLDSGDRCGEADCSERALT